MSDDTQQVSPGRLGAIYFGCGVIASGVISVFVGIAGALR